MLIFSAWGVPRGQERKGEKERNHDCMPSVGEALPHTLRVCPSCLSTPASINRPPPQTWGCTLHGEGGKKMKKVLLLMVLPPLSPPLERQEMRGREHRGVFLVG